MTKTNDIEVIVDMLWEDFEYYSKLADDARAEIPKKNSEAVYLNWSKRASSTYKAIAALKAQEARVKELEEVCAEQTGWNIWDNARAALKDKA